MNKLRVAIVTLLIVGGVGLFANGQQEEGKTKLTFMINFQSTEAVTQAFETVVADFEAEYPTIDIDLIPGGTDYEALMKSKMATNDLPDLWSTHGWSVLRYGEYLLPLEDEAWVARLHPSIEPVITSEEGHIYVLPLDVDIAGIAYNKTVLQNAGVQVEEIITWDDFYAAMATVKANGVTPVHIGGKDYWSIGNFFDWVAPALYVTDDQNYSGYDLVNGTFDTRKWEIAAGLLKEMQDSGYLNVDCLTSTYSDSARALAVGDAAFTFYGNYVVAEAWTYNEDADLGFFPVPSYYEGDQPSLISGERTTAGIWKDTPHPEEAKLFLSFLSRPEVIAHVAGANGIPAGMIDAHSNTGRLAEDFEKWTNVDAFPYFDRAYLPGGLWDTMCSTGTGILSGDMTIFEAAQKMNEDFMRLY